MFTKIKNGFDRLIRILDQFVKKVQKIIAPAITVGTVISVVYSVLAIILLFQSKMPASLVQGIRSFPYSGEILTILLFISFATLLLSGGIIEVFRLFGFAADFSFSPRENTYDPWDNHSLIEDILELIMILLPFVVVAMIVACVPAAFILIHSIKKHINT